MPNFQNYFLDKWSSWLSLNDSWSSKWWYSTVHIVTVTVGAGVLGLPTVMAYFRWELGTLLLVGFLILSQMCYWQLVELHETPQGTRFDRYHELGQHLLGESLGFWLIAPLQAIAQVGIDTVYVVTGGKSLQHVYQLLRDCGRSSESEGCNVKLTYWMMVFMGVQLCLSQLPHFESITWVSVIAAATAIGYCTFAWIAILVRDPIPLLEDSCFRNTNHDYPSGSAAHIVFGMFTSLGKLAFAVSAGQNVALEIQATIPSSRTHPSKRAMWRGILVAYLVVAFCYFPVALVGYQYYGNETRNACSNMDNILVILEEPTLMIVLADLMVFIHLCGSYQVLTMPLFSNMESIMETRFGLKLNFTLRMISRSIFVVCTFIVAAALPFFGDLQAFFGGLAIVPLTYVIPSVLWQLDRKPETLSPQWILNLSSIAFGVMMMFTSTIGGFRSLIVKRQSLKFFQ